MEVQPTSRTTLRRNSRHLRVLVKLAIDARLVVISRHLCYASTTNPGSQIRKIRCDGLLGGCSPCTQNHTECKTTDRITGRATTRGHVEELEQRSRDYLSRIRELEDRLISMGADVKPMVAYHDVAAAPLVQWNQAQGNGSLQTWEDNGASGSMMAYTSEPSSSRTSESNFIRLPEFRKGLHGDNYLGVSSGNSFLSSIRGTSLNVLGMEINIADFASTDLDGPVQPSLQQGPLYNKSYQSFVMSAFGTNPRLEKVALPPKTEGLTYAQWYFRALNPYLPTMHKPTFLSLVSTKLFSIFLVCNAHVC